MSTSSSIEVKEEEAKILSIRDYDLCLAEKNVYDFWEGLNNCHASTNKREAMHWLSCSVETVWE